MNITVIRAATVADAAEIARIYAPYVEKTAITFEYVAPDKNEFEKRIENTLKKYPYLVAINAGEITGYAYASAFKGRAAYDWSVETSVYVREDMHGKGIGGALYDALEMYLAKQNIINVNACITYPGEGSIAFHEKRGFKTVAHFSKCGYKFGSWHDMVWMEKFLGEHPEHPESVIPFQRILSMKG